jgi:hypothetical protein
MGDPRKLGPHAPFDCVIESVPHSKQNPRKLGHARDACATRHVIEQGLLTYNTLSEQNG